MIAIQSDVHRQGIACLSAASLSGCQKHEQGQSKAAYAELIQSLAGFEIGFIRSVCNQ